MRGVNAPVSKNAKPVDKPGIVVAIASDGAMYMQGHRFEGIRGVAEYLEDAHRRALEKVLMDGGTAADATLPLYIWADRAVPVRTIAEVAALADGEKRGKVAFPPRSPAAGKKPAAPDDDPPPPEEEDDDARQQAIKQARDAGVIGNKGAKPAPRPAHFIPRLVVTSTDKPAAIDATVGASLPATEPQSSDAVVQQLKSAIGSCDPIITTLGTISLEGTPEKQTAKLVADIPTSLTACNCKVANVDDLTNGMRLWFGAWAPSLAWIDMPKLKPNDKQPIGKLVK